MLFSPCPVDTKQLTTVESAAEAYFGPEMQAFLTNMGYLGYDLFETTGINAALPIEQSDLVKESRMLHQHFPSTVGMAEIAYSEEYGYFLVDEHDSVFQFDPEDDRLEDTGTKLFSFLLTMIETSSEFASELEDESEKI